MVSARGASVDAQVWPEAAHKRMIEPVVVQQTDNEIMVAVPGQDDLNHNRNSDNPRRDRASGKDAPASRRRNACFNWRWIVPLIVLVVVIVVLVVDLALKPEPADIDHSRVALREFTTGTNDSALNSSRLVLVLETVLVISNPNLLGRFQFYDGGVYLFYHGRQTGHSPIPPGEIPTQRSRNLSALVSAKSEALMADSAEEDSKGGVLPLSTETNMTGFVRKWAVFKQHFQIASVCDVLLSMRSHTLVSYSCHDKQ